MGQDDSENSQTNPPVKHHRDDPHGGRHLIIALLTVATEGPTGTSNMFTTVTETLDRSWSKQHFRDRFKDLSDQMKRLRHTLDDIDSENTASPYQFYIGQYDVNQPPLNHDFDPSIVYDISDDDARRFIDVANGDKPVETFANLTTAPESDAHTILRKALNAALKQPMDPTDKPRPNDSDATANQNTTTEGSSAIAKQQTTGVDTYRPDNLREYIKHIGYPTIAVGVPLFLLHFWAPILLPISLTLIGFGGLLILLLKTEQWIDT